MRLRLSKRQRWWAGSLAVHLTTVVVATVFIFPLYWMVILAFQKVSGRPDSLKILPFFMDFTMENVKFVLTETLFLTWFKNSFIVGVGTTIAAVIFSIFAGYALSRFQFWGRRPFAIGILLTQLLPGVLLVIPMYVLLASYRLTDTHLGLMIVYLTGLLPFSIWMLWGYFDSIPTELEESAMVDGCSPTGALFRIVLPLAAPGVAAVAIFTFVLAWQEYLFALVVISSPDMQLLTVGAANATTVYLLVWGRIGAFGALAALPVVVGFIFVQRYLVAGLTAGAVKG